MAKCFSCGKVFEYEKYYGICPKCGAYNREDLPEEGHSQMHEKYDGDVTCSRLEESKEPQKENDNYHKMPDCPGTDLGNSKTATGYGQANTSMPKAAQAKNSSLGTMIFVLLIIGIVATIAVPVLYLIGRSASISIKVVNAENAYLNGLANREPEELEEPKEEEPDVSPAPDSLERAPQEPDIVEAASNETCYLGKFGEQEITVGEARMLVPAEYLEDFPKNEKLVAIEVSYDANYEEYHTYDAMDVIYVGYGENTYKEIMSYYDMETYLDRLGSLDMIDGFDVTYGSGHGYMLVFVPEEVTNISLYLESRDEDTFELLEVYQIPLEIKPWEEI